jgi:hypothetical protein
MKRYKLLNPDRTTRGDTHWPIGQWNEAKGDPKQGLCSDGWLHCYDSPELALFLNPIHANISDPIVCEVETQGRSLNDKGLKRGYRRMRVVRDLDIPSPTTEQRIKFAILCGKAVYQNAGWNRWADNWLSGWDRSRAAIHAAYAAADAAAYGATYATHAAHAAAYAAYAAVYAAAYGAYGAYGAHAVADAAYVAAAAADIDLVAIAKRAMED